MTQLPIIFLDFDGVLNSQLFYMENPFRGSDLDIEAVERLNTLIKKTGAKVVISSTWRLGRSPQELQKILEDRGFKGEVIDKTPSFKSENTLRGNEILAWIKTNEKLIGAEYHKYKRYVILDDDSDMLYWQKDNFICVDGYCGITPKTIFMAEKILLDQRELFM